jgi:hypothetical protein
MESRIGTEEELLCQVCGGTTWHEPFGNVYRNINPIRKTIEGVKTKIYRSAEILVCTDCYSTKLRREDEVIAMESIESEDENGQIIFSKIENESIVHYPIIPNYENWNEKTLIPNIEGKIIAEIFKIYKESVESFNIGLFTTCGTMIKLGILAIYDYKKIDPTVFERLLTQKYHLSKYIQFILTLTELENIKILSLSISNRKELEVSIGVFEKLMIQRFFPQEDEYQSIKGILDRFDDSVTKNRR